jgi:hypothetical protein
LARKRRAFALVHRASRELASRWFACQADSAATSEHATSSQNSGS